MLDATTVATCLHSRMVATHHNNGAHVFLCRFVQSARQLSPRLWELHFMIFHIVVLNDLRSHSNNTANLKTAECLVSVVKQNVIKVEYDLQLFQRGITSHQRHLSVFSPTSRCHPIPEHWVGLEYEGPRLLRLGRCKRAVPSNHLCNYNDRKPDFLSKSVCMMIPSFHYNDRTLRQY